MRHNLGLGSALWAREVEGALREMEAPAPSAPDPLATPRVQTRVLHRLVTIDYDTPERLGVSPVLVLARPAWAKGLIAPGFSSDTSRPHPDYDAGWFNSYEVWVSTDSRPAWEPLYLSSAGAQGEFPMLNDTTVNLQMQDSEPMPVGLFDSLSMRVSLLITWMP